LHLEPEEPKKIAPCQWRGKTGCRRQTDPTLPGREDLRCPVTEGPRCPFAPYFDPESRCFGIGCRPIRRFARHAKNIRKLLAGLQNAGWPFCLDDPLGNLSEMGFRKRLENTVAALNRVCKGWQIRFASNGPDRKVRWSVSGAG
jgi:hypothetical protein